MEFSKSDDLSFGMELELQIVSSQTGRLSPSSSEFWESLKLRQDAARYSLEATLSTIEMNTSVHNNADAMLNEATALAATLAELARAKNLVIRGGGTQLTQFWNERVVAPTPRAQELTQRFGFLPKRFSTYGMHVHIGASTADKALQMGNGLQALVPLFIAMSAASPFLQMSDTGFCASRPLEPLIYPHGGAMPRFRDWAQFEISAHEIFSTGLAHSLKDIYWDVRPKPEFGTIEVRVFDTPLSVHKAVALAAFTRACAGLLLDGSLTLKDALPNATAERVSRFKACRDGMDAELFDPFTQEWMPARQLLEKINDAILVSPVSPADLPHIEALRGLITVQQDCQVMRNAWSESQAPYRQAPDVLLAHYSNNLSSYLLSPLSTTGH